MQGRSRTPACCLPRSPFVRNRLISATSTSLRGLPRRLPFARALRRPAFTLSTIRLRSSSATAPNTINSDEYRIPSSLTLTDAVKYYREVFAPEVLRASTFDVADSHIQQHLEADRRDRPVEHIDIDAVNVASSRQPERRFPTPRISSPPQSLFLQSPLPVERHCKGNVAPCFGH